MTGQDFARVKEVFLQACDLAPADRGAFLDRACDGNAAMRAEVESLLASDEHLTVADSVSPASPSETARASSARATLASTSAATR